MRRVRSMSARCLTLLLALALAISLSAPVFAADAGDDPIDPAVSDVVDDSTPDPDESVPADDAEQPDADEPADQPDAEEPVEETPDDSTPAKDTADTSENKAASKAAKTADEEVVAAQSEEEGDNQPVFDTAALGGKPESYEDYVRRADRGMYDILYALDRLPYLRTMTMTGAHPDDESNAMLTFMHDGYYAHSAYANLNWGEGGENSIGPEMYDQLGALRSQELRMARMYDGGKQYYVGTFDFGYSASVVESMINTDTGARGIYDPNLLLYNMVKILRETRTDVLVSQYYYPGGGHGQHVSAGYISEVAYKAAADPAYIVYDANGVEIPAWTVKRMFSSGGSAPSSTVVRVPLGERDPYVDPNYVSYSGNPDAPYLISDIGATYSAWGAESRSFHKCQKMDSKGSAGSNQHYTIRQAASGLTTVGSNSMLADFDTGITRINETLSTTDKNATQNDVDDLKAAIDEIIANFDDRNMVASVDSDIADAMTALEALEAYTITDAANKAGAYDYNYFLDLCREQLTDFVQKIYGFKTTVEVSNDNPVPGETIQVTVKLLSTVTTGANVPVFPANTYAAARDIVKTILPSFPVGYDTAASKAITEGMRKGMQYVFNVTVPASYKAYTGPFNQPYNESYTNPNYPMGTSDNYNAAEWTGLPSVLAAPSSKALSAMHFGNTTNPTSPYYVPIISSATTVKIAGKDFVMESAPDIKLVPKVSVEVLNNTVMFRHTGKDLNGEAKLAVRNNTGSAINVKLEGAADMAGVTVTGMDSVSIAAGERKEITLPVKIASTVVGKPNITFTATMGAEQFTEGYHEIAYWHIQTQHFYSKAVQQVSVSKFGLADDNIRIGYFKAGTDDAVFDYIAQMYTDSAMAAKNLSVITPDDLATLTPAQMKAKYDTVVVGKQPWGNSLPIYAVIRQNYKKFLEYADLGGNLVVHYQNFTASATNGKVPASTGENVFSADEIGKMPLAPAPFTMVINGPGNLNEEDGPVFVDTALKDNALFNSPNVIPLDLEAGTGIVESKGVVWDGWKQQRCEWTAGPGGTGRESQIDYCKNLGYDVLFTGLDPLSSTVLRPAILHKGMANGGHYTYSSVVWDRQLYDLVPGAYELYSNLLCFGYTPKPADVNVSKITLNATTKTIAVTKTFTLTPTIAPANATNKAVTWTSSDKTIATVTTAGVVKGIKAGKATITCTAKDGSGKKATCTVTVTQPVTGIKLNTTVRTVPVGTTYTLKPTVSPTNATNKAVTWTSSDKKIATVTTAGVVKGIKAGKVTITCTAKDGSGKKATCTIYVGKKVTSVKLNTTATTVKKGATVTLKKTIAPSDAAYKSVTWTSSNKAVATVSSTGVVKGIKAGKVTITCTAKDGSGKKATCTVTVK